MASVGDDLECITQIRRDDPRRVSNGEGALIMKREIADLAWSKLSRNFGVLQKRTASRPTPLAKRPLMGGARQKKNGILFLQKANIFIYSRISSLCWLALLVGLVGGEQAEGEVKNQKSILIRRNLNNFLLPYREEWLLGRLVFAVCRAVACLPMWPTCSAALCKRRTQWVVRIF